MRGIVVLAMVLALPPPGAALAQEPARPRLLHREAVPGMPGGGTQEIQVLTAEIAPGQSTVFHTHRHPVTVYMLQGTFTLEMEGRAPVALGPGQAMVEPAGVRMTGFNRSADVPIRLVIFYVAEPGTPFLDPIR